MCDFKTLMAASTQVEEVLNEGKVKIDDLWEHCNSEEDNEQFDEEAIVDQQWYKDDEDDLRS